MTGLGLGGLSASNSLVRHERVRDVLKKTAK